MNKKEKDWRNPSNRASWGLFYKKCKWRNIKELKTYFARKRFVKKHGYYPQAEWETFNYFIDMFREIFTWYRYNRSGNPLVIDLEKFNAECDDDINAKAVDELYDTLIDLLDKMDERNPIYDKCSLTEVSDKTAKAKNEFFELFSKYFYYFWD